MKVQSADVQSGWIKLSHWQILMLLSFGRKIGLQIICTTSVYLADYPQTCCNRFRNGHRIFIKRMYADLGPNTQLFQRFLLCSLILETFNMVNVTVVKNQVAKTNYFFVGSAQVVYICNCLDIERSNWVGWWNEGTSLLWKEKKPSIIVPRGIVSSHSNVDRFCVCWYRQKLDKVSSSMFVIAAMSSDNSSIVCIMPGGCTQVFPLFTRSYQYLNVLNQPCLKRKFILTTSFIQFKFLV